MNGSVGGLLCPRPKYEVDIILPPEPSGSQSPRIQRRCPFKVETPQDFRYEFGDLKHGNILADASSCAVAKLEEQTS